MSKEAVSQEKIFKTVKIVNDQGVGTEIDFGYRIRQFKCKNGCEHHNHMVCLVCGAFSYIDNENLEDQQDSFVKSNGFTPKKINLKIYGICQKCN